MAGDTYGGMVLDIARVTAKRFTAAYYPQITTPATLTSKSTSIARHVRCGLVLAAVLFSVVMARAGSVVTVDTNNVLAINGRKVFTIGFSPGPPNYAVTPTGKDALQEFRDAGALLFRINQTGNWDSTVISTQQVALDWAAQHGMYCWVNLRELSEFAATDTNTPASLRNIVDTFRNHAALGLWKNFDEAWWSGISVSNLYNGYAVIKQEDTNHPVVQTHAPRGTVANLQPYNIATDVLALDIYPVTAAGSASNPPITNTAISQLGDWTDVLGQIANGQKQYWLIEQIAFSGTTPPAHTLVFPTYTQARFMAYEAINNGARGLMYFGGNIMATLNAQDAPLGWNWTFWTNVLKPIVQQLGDHGLLANALVAPASALPINFSGATAPDIEFCVREVPPYVYILASKRETAATTVTFSGLPAWAATGEVLFESPRTVAATGGQFTDTFQPLDVHVYRFAQSNVAPTILFPPQNLTNTAGTGAAFSVIADGTGSLAYRWRKNGTNLNDGGAISGASSSALTFSTTVMADAAGYDVVVTGFGSVTSTPPAMLTLIASSNQPPVITSQPQSRTNTVGTTATFSVTASGGDLSYQWIKNGTTNLTDGGNVSGSLTATLTLTGVAATDAANYSVLVTNALGSQTSIVAPLTVTNAPLFYEPFNYPVGVNLGGQVNGDGLAWSDIGTLTAGPYVTVTSNSLGIPGLMPSLGNSIQFGGLGKSARFSFPSGNPVTSGTVYYSFALQVPDTNGLSSSGIFVAGFNNSVGTQTNQPAVVGTRVYIRAAANGFNLAVAKNSSTSTDWVWDPRTFTTNQVLFVVGSYTFNPATNDDISKMWINPAPATFGAAVEPAVSVFTTNGPDMTANQIASFVFLQRSSSEPELMIADELRLGSTWASVTPPAVVPRPVITNFLRLGGGAFQFGYTNSSFQTFSVWASSDLSAWSSLGPASNTAPGQYQFTDTNAGSFLRRFYQLRSP